jgi:hypothetical protein
MLPALPVPMLPLLDDALLPDEPLAWLPVDEEPEVPDEPLAMLPPDDKPLLPDEPLAWLPLDEAEPPLLAWVPPLDGDCLFELVSFFDEPIFPDPLEPMLPEPWTFGEPLPAWVPPAPLCVESLPMLIPVPSFDF